MKKKLALLMAAIMTVAMVPVTALASTKINCASNVKTAVGDEHPFTSRIELKNDNEEVNGDQDGAAFDFLVTLENGKFAKDDNLMVNGVKTEDKYVMINDGYLDNTDAADGGTGKKVGNGYADISAKITDIDVISDTKAKITVATGAFSKDDVLVLPVRVYALAEGDVKANLYSNEVIQFDKDIVIATAYGNKIEITNEGVKTFVEDSVKTKTLEDINLTGLVNGALTGKKITLKLTGSDYKFETGQLFDGTDGNITIDFMNDAVVDWDATFIDDEEIEITFDAAPVDTKRPIVTISGIKLTAKKSASAGDVAKIKISSQDFDAVTLEVAKMVEEAVTYTVEDKDLPTIWAGKDYGVAGGKLDDTNTLKVSVEENTGDILNTSRKATFTFPEGIEVVGFKIKGAPVILDGNAASTIFTADEASGTQGDDFDGKPIYEIDENVLTIWNYQKKATVNESDADKGKTDFDIDFVLNAAPTFNGDVEVTLGGEFDDVTLKVATVKAPYTVEAKTTEVLIDYRYVPVNEIVITEAEEGLLEEDDIIVLAAERMDFEDAGAYEVTSGDIEVDVDVYDETRFLEVTIKDESTEPSTIVISGLELYLDRTLPVGGYALLNISPDASDYSNVVNNILWENSDENKAAYDLNGIFKYKDFVCNDNYVEVVTQARDQDDYTTNRKIVLTIGATTMAVGTDTITLDTPAYINSENYTQLPLRAVSEAFGATVNWDDASRTVTIMMGQRVVSMTIGSKTMYVNGTPVAMNTAPEITNSRTFVPVRDLANALGITKIDWNEASATVTLN